MKVHYNYWQIVDELRTMRARIVELGADLPELRVHPNLSQIREMQKVIRDYLVDELGQEILELKQHPSVFQIRELFPVLEVAVSEEEIEAEAGYTGPLDLVSGAIVAYGQRALSSAKRGSALYTIRRSSDDTTQSFSSDGTTGDAPIALISAFIGGGDGFVSTWVDQSGNSNNVVQATAARQPEWVSSTLNSKPGLEFTAGSHHWLGTSGNVATVAGATTVFCVVKATVNGDTNLSIAGINGDEFVGTDGPSWGFFLSPDGEEVHTAFRVNFYGDELDYESFMQYETNFATDFDQYYLIEHKLSADGVTVMHNGTAYTVSTPTFSDIGNIEFQFGIGTLDVAESADHSAPNFNGQIIEYIHYPSVLSNEDCTLIRQNIASYYGITIA